MNYEDDELERMRARREGRSSRASQAGYSSRGSSASGTSRRRVSSTVENSQRKGEAGSGSVRSGYSDPKSAGSGKKSLGRRGSHYRKSARHRKHMIIAAEIVVIILMILGGAFWYAITEPSPVGGRRLISTRTRLRTSTCLRNRSMI